MESCQVWRVKSGIPGSRLSPALVNMDRKLPIDRKFQVCGLSDDSGGFFFRHIVRFGADRQLDSAAHFRLNRFDFDRWKLDAGDRRKEFSVRHQFKNSSEPSGRGNPPESFSNRQIFRFFRVFRGLTVSAESAIIAVSILPIRIGGSGCKSRTVALR